MGKKSCPIPIFSGPSLQDYLFARGLRRAEVFQIFIDELAKHTERSEKKIVLVLDNASWHKSECLNWHHIEPKFLPAYSPDLNPIEILWLCLKQRFFTNWFARSLDELIERTCLGLRSFFDDPAAVRSITTH